MRLIKINYYVMPDLISLPRQLVSRGQPEYSVSFFLDSGFRRNDKSLRLPAHEVIGRATMENFLRLKARGFNHPRKGH
jgi:hypothetical protein